MPCLSLLARRCLLVQAARQLKVCFGAKSVFLLAYAVVETSSLPAANVLLSNCQQWLYNCSSLSVTSACWHFVFSPKEYLLPELCSIHIWKRVEWDIIHACATVVRQHRHAVVTKYCTGQMWLSSQLVQSPSVMTLSMNWALCQKPKINCRSLSRKISTRRCRWRSTPTVSPIKSFPGALEPTIQHIDWRM